MEIIHYVVSAVISLLLLPQAAYISGCPVPCTCNATWVSCRNQSIVTVPSDVPAAQYVESLDLHDNQISSLTNVFHKYTSIKVLDLSSNQISALLQTNFQNNTKLNLLDLQHNVIQSIHPDAFETLLNLTVLNLAHNLISSLPNGIFNQLKSVEHIDLHNNALTDISGVLDNNEWCVTLDLSYNKIRDIHEVLETLPNLQTLNLSHNQLNNIDGQSFHVNSSVNYLNLSYNQIQHVNNLSLIPLDILDLSWNNITDISMSTFKGLWNLSELILDGNLLESIDSAVFQDLSSLQTLSLSQMPNLQYLSPHTFQGLDNLTTLLLHHNPQLSFIHKQLFIPLRSLSIMDISFNHIVFLSSAIYPDNNTRAECNKVLSAYENHRHLEPFCAHPMNTLTSLDVRGNNFSCDCSLEWLVNGSKSNNSIIKHADTLQCYSQLTNNTLKLVDINHEDLHCTDVNIIYHSQDSKFKIGHSATLKCVAEGTPVPEIIWITPRKHLLKYHNFHEYSTLEFLSWNDSFAQSQNRTKYEDMSYSSMEENSTDRMRILKDGSLYIDYVLRTDGGSYKCIAKNPRNQTEVTIVFYLDYSVINEIKIWSLVVGGACAGSVFLLNLTYSLVTAAIRRCVSQRRRERIRRVLESMDQYKTAQLTRIKENYNHQVGRIRDQYHYQLGRLREHHQSQVSRMGRMREGASMRVEKLRDNYNNQLGRLKEYSSSQLVQIREKYNNQIYKIKDYGTDKMDRIHEKYKFKQQHVIKLLEMMNLDNCRTVFESECVRTESMILQSDIFTTDVPISPLDSVSVSDSEYLTATSSESSKYTSKENLNSTQPEGAESELSFVASSINKDKDDNDDILPPLDIEETLKDTASHTDIAIDLEDCEGSSSLDMFALNLPLDRKRSSRSKRRDSGKHRKSRPMVLKLPHDDCSEESDLLMPHERKRPKSEEIPSGSNSDVQTIQSPCDMRHLVDVKPGTSSEDQEEQDLLVLPGSVIRESIV